MRIIMVCTGNTCRSPMAEALLLHALFQKGIEGVRVESAGIFACPGSPASQEAVWEMRERGLDIKDHRSQHIRLKDIKDALVLCMTRGHVEELKTIAPYANAQTLLGYAGLGESNIEDPIGRGQTAYHEAADQMQAAAERIAEKLSRGK